MPTLKKFTGLNNVVRVPEAAGLGDLQLATNVYIDNSNMIVRRPAFTATYESICHSVNGDSGELVFVDDDELVYNGAPVQGSLTPALPMGYLWLNDMLYFSNGAQSGVVKNGTARSWGIAAPPVPTVANASGSLDAATYQVALTYLRDDGQESPASTSVMVHVTTGGISITNITPSNDTSVIGTVVYLTGVGGETRLNGLRLVTILPISTTTHNITDRGAVGSGRPCLTYGASPPPYGTRFFFYNGRVYIISGTTMWWTLPYMYEHVDLDRNFVEFQTEITAAVPTTRGVWIGTETEMLFLAGADPESEGGLRIITKVPCGVACGALVDSALTNQRYLDIGAQALLVTTAGVIVGDSSGKYENVTGDRWVAPSTTSSFMCVDSTNPSPQAIFDISGTTYFLNIDNGAVCSTNLSFNSAATIDGVLIGANSAGIHAAVAADVDTVGQTTTPVAAVIKKSGLSFGTNAEKLLTEVYLTARTAEEMQVIARTGDTIGIYTTDSVISANVLELRGHKCRIGRGLRGRTFELTVENQAGVMFDLAEIDINVSSVDNRHGRQMHG